MEISVLSPVAATAFDWTLAGGNRAVTVVCKLTFPLQPGTDAPLHASQEPITLQDRYEGPAGSSSLVAATDLVPYKAGVDVVVTGFACAPPGRPATTVRARVVVGKHLDKSLDVTGPRAWLPDGRATPAAPFDRVVLRWEAAAGGPGTDNPVGLAPGDGRPAPQIVRAGAVLDGGGVAPAGFGPIAPAWPARAQKLGGAPVLRSDWAREPLPWTIDPSYFNVAPPDQRLGSLPPNESILLFGLLPDREKFGMRLPGLQPRAFAQNGGEGKDVPLTADTLWIDTGRALVTVTWRGQVPVGTTVRRVVVALERDRPLTWADIERRLATEARGSGVWAAAPIPSPLPPSPALASAPLPAFIGQRSGETPEPRRGQAAPAPVTRVGPIEPVDLLWFDPALAPRLRTIRPWRRLIDALELVASDDGAAGEVDDRREIFQVIANGEARDAAGMTEALAAAIAPDGKLDPPLVLTSGDLTLPFDATELLRVTLSTCKPVAPTDKAFAEVVAAATTMAEAGALPDAVAQGLTYRLREAFQQVKHTLPARYLETTADRAMLEGRRHQKREVFGALHLRGLVVPSSGDPVPAYLPLGVASRLPLFPRFRSRLIVEVHPQVDHGESHACALRVLAVARVVPRPGLS